MRNYGCAANVRGRGRGFQAGQGNRHGSVTWFFREVLCLMLCKSFKALSFDH
jgi:hypothetical protein